MKVGRPSKYDPKYVKELYRYLEEATPQNMKIPSVEGFALRIDTAKKTIYRWGKKNKEFRHALRVLKMRQKEDLVEIGIFGGKEINSNIVSLMLKVNHKMVETSKTDITSDGKSINPILVRFVEGKADGDTNTD